MKSLHDRHRLDNGYNRLFIGGIIIIIILVALPFIFPNIRDWFRDRMRGVWLGEQYIVSSFYNTGAFFRSKQILQSENDRLQSELVEARTQMLDYNILTTENINLKETLGRAVSHSYVLGTILVKPNRSAYDTVILDIGKESHITVGNFVFAYSVIPIGTITSVGNYTSTVTLFSTSGQKITGRIENLNIDVELTGRGGGNFEMQVPRDVVITSGMKVLLPSLNPLIIAEVSKSITDARDPVQTFLLTSPVNINQLNSVEVEY